MGLFDLFRRGSGNAGADETADPTPAAPAAPTGPPPSANPFLQITEEAWDDMDDDQRMQWCMQQFQILKAEYGGDGKLKRNTADERLTLRTTFEGRPVSISVGYDTGWFDLKMKFVNRLGHLVLHFDEDKKLSHSDSHQEGDDDWEDDKGEVTHVFVPGVYIEEYDAEARPMIQLVQSLPAEVRDQMFTALQHRHLDRLFVDSEVVETGTHHSIYEMTNPKEEIDRAFAAMHAVTEAFSQGTREVGPKARVYMRGQPVFPQGVPQRQPCAYCGVNYTRSDDDPRCPGCGAAS